MEDSELNQHNKIHKGAREKIKKKRKHEKEIKKSKKIKKKEKNLEKSKKKKHEKKDKNAPKIKVVRFDKIATIIKKFLKVFQDDLEDFYSIFQNFDEGGSIDLTEIENPKIKRYLKKIFKYFLLKKNDTEYKKNEEKNNFNLRNKIQTLVENSYFDTKSSDSDSDSSKSDEDKEKIEIENPLVKQKKEEIIKDIQTIKQLDKNSLQNSQIQINDLNAENTNIINEKKDVLLPTKKIYGVGFISEEEKKKFIEESLGRNIEDQEKNVRDEWMTGDNLGSFIDDSFKKIENQNKEKKNVKKNNDLNNEKKPIPKYLQSLFKKGKEDEEERTAEEIQEQEQIKEYMKEYDESHNRTKSLMEIHKEKIKGKHKGKQERREFDRNVDLQINRNDSKKIFSILNNSDNSLGNRFSNSKFEKSFL